MASDMYMKADAIKGESTDDQHKGWIQLEHLSTSLMLPSHMGAGQGGLSRGTAEFSDFQIMKKLDISSADLGAHCSLGKPIKEINFEFCLSSGNKEPYMTYKLEDAVISSFAIDFGGDVPTESITIGFGKVTWKYTQWGHDGQKGAEFEKFYDLKTNVGG